MENTLTQTHTSTQCVHSLKTHTQTHTGGRAGGRADREISLSAAHWAESDSGYYHRLQCLRVFPLPGRLLSTVIDEGC